MSAYWMWWIAAAALVAAELLTGTFYLLVVGVALAFGGVAAWFDVSVPRAMADCRCVGRDRDRPAPAMEAQSDTPDTGAAGARHRADGPGPELGTGWNRSSRLPGQHLGRGARHDRCSASQDHVHRGNARLGADPFGSPPRGFATTLANTLRGGRNADGFLDRHTGAIPRRRHHHRQGDSRRPAAARAGHRALGAISRRAARPD